MRPSLTALDPPPVYAEIARSVTMQTALASPTRSDLLHQVVGAPSSDGYFYGGVTVAAGIRTILMTLGSSIRDFPRILDWGCGSGRVVRWFEDVAPAAEFVGTDINDDAVRWCQKNLRFGSYQRNGYRPPLPFPDGYFDLVYGISVVTHLDEDFQQAWLTELDRVTRPGGLVLLSVHAEDFAAWELPAADQAAFRRDGFLYKRTHDASVEGLPDFYQVAFHSRPYIERVWTRFFEVVMYVKHGPLFKQQLVVLRKPHGGGSFRSERAAVVVHDLPLACWDIPLVGRSVTAPGTLDVAGWAFHPDGKNVRLRVWLDGHAAAECAADQDRPDVERVFSWSAAARRSGFVARVDLADSRAGLHALWITSEESPIPLCTTFFRVD
jgi:SAM-dependent methyltransferase